MPTRREFLAAVPAAGASLAVAGDERVPVVDVPFFERAATF